MNPEVTCRALKSGVKKKKISENEKKKINFYSKKKGKKNGGMPPTNWFIVVTLQLYWIGFTYTRVCVS